MQTAFRRGKKAVYCLQLCIQGSELIENTFKILDLSYSDDNLKYQVDTPALVSVRTFLANIKKHGNA